MKRIQETLRGIWGTMYDTDAWVLRNDTALMALWERQNQDKRGDDLGFRTCRG